MKIGDLVTRKSYGGDVVFTISGFAGDRAFLKGTDYRLIADAPAGDLASVTPEAYAERTRGMDTRAIRSAMKLGRSHRLEMRQTRRDVQGKSAGTPAYFEMPGRVLHLDGDPSYLRKSLALYKELRIPAVGYYVTETDMAAAVRHLLPQARPDILVLTGHDGILKDRKRDAMFQLASYKNSYNFANAVKAAREFDRNRDSLIIVAGACQSHFEALLQAGANFASSPGRVLIHALDPLYVASKMSFASARETVRLMDVLPYTLSGVEGMGGIESRGSFRLGLPSVTWKASDTIGEKKEEIG